MSTLDTLEQKTREDNRTAAYWLLFYPDEKHQYELERLAILQGSPPRIQEIVAGKRRKNPVFSDPTGRKGEKLAGTRYQWLKLVEDVERRLPPKMLVFLRLRREYRYNVGCRGWTAQIQSRYPAEMARLTGKEEGIFWVEDRRTFTRWWERIVNYAAREAIRRGLL